MTPANTVGASEQAEIFRVEVKKRLVELNLTVTDLALRLGLARNTVSMAINQPGLFHAVKARIKEEVSL